MAAVLSGHDALSPMKARSVRVPAMGVPILVGAASGELINMSLTGALVRLSESPPIAQETFVLIGDPATAVPLRARIVRCEPLSGPSPGRLRRWLIALSFTDDDRKAVIMDIMQGLHRAKAQRGR